MCALTDKASYFQYPLLREFWQFKSDQSIRCVNSCHQLVTSVRANRFGPQFVQINSCIPIRAYQFGPQFVQINSCIPIRVDQSLLISDILFANQLGPINLSHSICVIQFGTINLGQYLCQSILYNQFVPINSDHQFVPTNLCQPIYDNQFGQINLGQSICDNQFVYIQLAMQFNLIQQIRANQFRQSVWDNQLVQISLCQTSIVELCRVGLSDFLS